MPRPHADTAVPPNKHATTFFALVYQLNPLSFFQLLSIASSSLCRGLSTTHAPRPPLPRTRRELVGSLPPIYPHDLTDDIRRDVDALGRMLVVLDDDPTGTQTVHGVPVLAEWSVDVLAREVL